MANINISDLRPAGADLFLDSESYLNDLTEGEMLIFGGRWCVSFWCCSGGGGSSPTCSWTCSLGACCTPEPTPMRP